MKLSSNIWFAFRFKLLDRRDASGTCRAVMQNRFLALGRLADRAQDVEHARAEDDEVNDDEGDQRRTDRLGIDVGETVGGPEQPIDGIRLPSALGRVPARQYRD